MKFNTQYAYAMDIIGTCQHKYLKNPDKWSAIVPNTAENAESLQLLTNEFEGTAFMILPFLLENIPIKLSPSSRSSRRRRSHKSATSPTKILNFEIGIIVFDERELRRRKLNMSSERREATVHLLLLTVRFNDQQPKKRGIVELFDCCDSHGSRASFHLDHRSGTASY